MKKAARKKVLIIGGTGLVGGAIAKILKPDYQVIITSGHHEIEDGYVLPVEDTELLEKIIQNEKPDIVVSSIVGDFHSQLVFHKELARLLRSTGAKLLFISTANVFDGDLSHPRFENDRPTPESQYGMFKRDCEHLLQEEIPDQLIIFRLSTVWSPDCARIRQLREYENQHEKIVTYDGDMINVTFADQIGHYAKYVLDTNLRGIFHVGSKDMVNYYEFQKLVCDRLNIEYPEFEIEKIAQPAFQAVIPGRKEIPESMQLSIAEVLELLGDKRAIV